MPHITGSPVKIDRRLLVASHTQPHLVAVSKAVHRHRVPAIDSLSEKFDSPFIVTHNTLSIPVAEPEIAHREAIPKVSGPPIQFDGLGDIPRAGMSGPVTETSQIQRPRRRRLQTDADQFLPLLQAERLDLGDKGLIQRGLESIMDPGVQCHDFCHGHCPEGPAYDTCCPID